MFESQLCYFAPQMVLQRCVNHFLPPSQEMQLFLAEQAFDISRMKNQVRSFNRFVQHATLTTAGKFSTDKNYTAGSRIIRPLSRAFKNILSPCSKAFS